MRGPKRTKDERLIQREEIIRLASKRVSQPEIARRMGLSLSQVEKDLAAAREEYRQRYARTIHEEKEATLYDLDELIRTYWEAWLRTLDEHTFKMITTVDGVARITEKTVSLQDGNPAFLQGIERCIQQRRELLGLDAPKKQALTDDEGNAIPLVVLRQLFLQAVQGQVIEGEVVKELPEPIGADDHHA